MNKLKQYITSVLINVFVVVNIIGLPPILTNHNKPSSYVLYASSLNSSRASVIVKVGGDKIPPERITSLIANPRLITGQYPSEELGGRVELTWIAPKDPEVFNVHPDTYVFSYVIKYDTSLRGYDLNYLDQLLGWWNDAEMVFSNHIWELPLQAKGQTLEVYPMRFGIASPEEKYKLTFGITDKIIITGLPKGEKIWIGVASRDRYYNQSIPTVIETYVPASIVPPSKVTDLAASYSGIPGTIKLTWTSPANDRFSVDASSGLYNIPDGRYCIAYSTTLPETLDLEPGPLIYNKWPNVKLIYIDTSTLKNVEQTYLITGLPLTEGTTSIGYYFLLWTSDEWLNKNNWSKRSNLAGYGLVAPDYVSNIVVISSGSIDLQKGSYAIISWKNPKDEDIPIEGVKIYYSTNTYTTKENYFVKYTTQPSASVTAFHYQLLPRHWYYYVLMSYNSAGSRPWTTEVIAKTYTEYDFIPPDAVTSLEAQADANDTDKVYISLSWINPDENLYQNKDFYIDGRIEVVYSSVSFTDTNSKVKLLPATSNTVKLTALEPYTTYYINIITADGGNNKSTTTITVYTPYDPYPPDPPKILSYQVLASTDENVGSYIRFNLKNPYNKDLKEVRVYYSSSSWSKDVYIVLKENKPLEEYFVEIKQLYPRTTYYFTFVSYDYTNKHSYDLKEAIFIDKDILAPELPANIQLVADANSESKPYGSTIKLSYDILDTTKYRNWDIAGYEVYLSSSNSTPYEDKNAIHKIITDITQLTDEILNLEQHTTYYITLHSFDPVANKSTSNVFSVFTWKDLVPPRQPKVEISSFVVSQIPQEGLSIKVLNILSDEIDIDKIILELYNDNNFNNIVSSVTAKAYPKQQFEYQFVMLDVETTYYFKTKVFDWSNNVSYSTLSYIVKLPADNTIPLYPVGLKAEVENNTLKLSWKKVEHQYNSSVNRIEKFKGVNNLGALMPTTYELYKYKILYKQNLTDDKETWKELVSLTPDKSSCDLELKEGYYKVVSYDITGNYDESLVVDNNLNYYIYKDNVYVKFTQNNGLAIANNLLYYGILEEKETEGNLLNLFSVALGNLNEEEGEIAYLKSYRFDEENLIGIKYAIENGKAKINFKDKNIEIDAKKLKNQIAFYVFDGKEYVRATTYLDEYNQVIYFKTKFLSKVQVRKVEIVDEFKFIEAKPKIITPDSSLGENDVVLFVFNNPNGAKVKISIYDINSLLVWETYTTQDSSIPGSFISWDGRNLDGKFVQPGVYLYQIEAENKVYKGSIVVVR